jgi:hypothetical protein
MKSAVLAVISLTPLTEIASDAASAQRGLISGPSADPSSASSNSGLLNRAPTWGARRVVSRLRQFAPSLWSCGPRDFVMGANDTPYVRSPSAPIGIRREVTFAEWKRCIHTCTWKVELGITAGGAATVW